MAVAEYFFNNPRPLNPCREIVYGYTEANSQSFKAGELVKFSSGVAAVASDSSTGILGIALKDATNVTSGNIEIPIYPAYSVDTWVFKLTNGGTAALASAFTQGTRYGNYTASNVCYVDLAETTTDLVIYIEPLYRESVSTTLYWGQFRFIPANCYFEVGTGA